MCVIKDKSFYVIVKAVQTSSTGGLVGYDDWFTPSRSGVRFSPCVLCFLFLHTYFCCFSSALSIATRTNKIGCVVLEI